MDVSVGQAADALGVSRRRVVAMIAAGRVRARRIGHEWLVDGASLPARSRRSRPMSRPVAWEFLDDEPPRDDPRAAWRWRERRNRLARDAEPESLLASWVASRGDREVFVGSNPLSVLDDSRVVPSGVSDPRAGLSAADMAEGWVRAGDLAAVRRAHLLRRAEGRFNVVLHVADHLPQRPVPRLLVAADLADHEGPRELGRARDLIRQAIS